MFLRSLRRPISAWQDWRMQRRTNKLIRRNGRALLENDLEGSYSGWLELVESMPNDCESSPADEVSREMNHLAQEGEWQAAFAMGRRLFDESLDEGWARLHRLEELSDLLCLRRRFDEALEAEDERLRIARSLGLEMIHVGVAASRADVLRCLNRPGEGMKECERGLEFAVLQQAEAAHARLLSCQGLCSLMLGETDRARGCLEEASVVLVNKAEAEWMGGIQSARARVSRTWAEYFLESGDFEASAGAARESLAIEDVLQYWQEKERWWNDAWQDVRRARGHDLLCRSLAGLRGSNDEEVVEARREAERLLASLHLDASLLDGNS